MASLTDDDYDHGPRDSLSSASTTSLVFDHIDDQNNLKAARMQFQTSGHHHAEKSPFVDSTDLETARFLPSSNHDDGGELMLPSVQRGMDRSLRKYGIVGFCILTALWVVTMLSFLSSGSPSSTSPQRHLVGNPVTLDSVLQGQWRANSHDISWISGPDGEDGLLMERDAKGKDFLVVEDVRSIDSQITGKNTGSSRTLIQKAKLSYNDTDITPQETYPNTALTKVLIASNVERNWRRSFSAVYWILDVESQSVQPLIPGEPSPMVQLASWSPTGDAIAFTRDNNIYIRSLESDDKEAVTQITKDGGREYFYGIPDWVYEEEVFGGNSATWWSDDGKFIAFLRTNESGVPEYPIDYYVSRPNGDAEDGEEAYPDVRQIKYPKAGAHNPVVDLLFFSVEKGDVFSIEIEGEFANDDRLITTVLWAGDKVLVKETNRVSDIMRVVLIDVETRTGKAIQTINVKDIDGGWFEISTKTKFIPADPKNGRPHDGYIDSVIYENRDHLAYFSPMDNPEPIMLTKGDWEVEDAPSAVDLKNNLVYFVSTKESSIQRHVYSVKLDGSDLKPLTNVSTEGYYDVSFSDGAGFALLSYRGPDIPWQKIISTPGNPSSYSRMIEENADLAKEVSKTDLPTLVYGTIMVEGVNLNYVERRPANFNPSKKYPVLFQQYSGPGSQSVSKRFSVDFQSYVASSLGYLCVTVDGRGTGFIGRKARVVVRGQLGVVESHDQIAAAQHWSSLPYVDASRLAIWGWSFGGFNTLKTLEVDAGKTFSYGMAVAPVTDWRYYDSIYTERYMLTPQENPDGYKRSAVTNATALGESVRFLVMHGTGDDNVHMQNTLTLLDKLDMSSVENYDLHLFPDSNHGIYFHNANRIVYDKLSNWLINAFNGEWLKVNDPSPKPEKKKRDVKLRETGTKSDF
ncbi:putative dipeptidyl-aminopeptidase B [Ceratocystis lukuohia]|uniref:Probable dipeptidyl-aminopeptidase B n=1 Tax=Ceratocystis lukuohia TaxID=2019550 RepID=A0ABR4MCY3_9PEZI